MDFNGYKRTKKFDIKRWFKGTNSIVYLVILVVMVLGLLFVLRTVISMHNSNKNLIMYHRKRLLVKLTHQRRRQDTDNCKEPVVLYQNKHSEAYVGCLSA